MLEQRDGPDLDYLGSHIGNRLNSPFSRLTRPSASLEVERENAQAECAMLCQVCGEESGSCKDMENSCVSMNGRSKADCYEYRTTECILADRAHHSHPFGASLSARR